MIRRFFQVTLLCLDALLLLLFGIGYVARYIPPRFAWWAEIIATLLPYLALALLVATVVVGVERRWKLFGVHLAFVFLALIRFVPVERLGTPEASRADLVVLTYNTSRGGGARADVQAPAITELLRAEKPHIAAIQESFVEFHPTAPYTRPEERLKPLVDSLGYQAASPGRVQGAIYTAQPVLGRVRFLEQSQTKLKGAGSEENATRVVRVRFEWQGQEAVLYNLHLKSFGSQKPWEDEGLDPFSFGFWKEYLRQYRDAYLVRAQEVAQVRAMIAAETLPVIVCGDLNSTPHNWDYRQVRKGLADAFLVAGRGWGATYHARLPFARIDHVLVSPEWEVVGAHIGEAPVSDHLPLVVRLRWR